MLHTSAHGQRATSYHPALRGNAAPSSLDQRHHGRARARWQIRLIGAGEAIVAGWVCDVSEGGLGLMSRVNVPVGSVLETALAVPHPSDPRRSLTVRAKVRVVSSAFCGTQSRLGVQFMALPMAARLAIRKYTLSHS